MQPSSNEPSSEPVPSHRSSAVRHVVFSIALWVTYVLYWKIVLDRGVDPAARFSLVLLGLFIALQVLFTIAWILHNDRIARVHAGTAPCAARERANREAGFSWPAHRRISGRRRSDAGSSHYDSGRRGAEEDGGGADLR